MANYQTDYTTLPGTKDPYVVRAGFGERYLVGSQLVTFIARHQDTGGLLEAAVIEAEKDAEFPLHMHPAGRECIFLLRGRIDLDLAGKVYGMHAGDCACFPPGTDHGYRVQSHHTRLLIASFGGELLRLFAALGERCDAQMYPPDPPQPVVLEDLSDPTLPDVKPYRKEVRDGSLRGDLEFLLPHDELPFVLESGEGSRLVVADQLFTFLARGRNTNEQYLALMTEGPAGDPVPLHFHEKHTEVFYCLEGGLKMLTNGNEIILGPGDLLHCPAGTVHSYQMIAPHNQFLGFLAPALFEPFFDYLGDPWQAYVYPAQPLPFRFDRVLAHLQDLDLKLVDSSASPMQAALLGASR